jgi:hypothetical protein
VTKPRPIADGNEIGHLVGALKKLGFTMLRTSRSGSRYMRYGPRRIKVRISDHPLAIYSPDVLVNEIVTPPLTATDVALLALDIGVRFVCLARERKGLIRDKAA